MSVHAMYAWFGRVWVCDRIKYWKVLLRLQESIWYAALLVQYDEFHQHQHSTIPLHYSKQTNNILLNYRIKEQAEANMANVQSIFELRAVKFAEYTNQEREKQHMGVEDVSFIIYYLINV